MHRRDRWAILTSILAMLDEEERSVTPAAMSRIAQRANLPYDRFLLHIAELREGGLVNGDARPLLTDKGRVLLRSWRQWDGVLHNFGLA